jgi:hypothetical protein
VHLELAALYRQAARLDAEATLQVYGADHQATDPNDVQYLVSVSRALLARGRDEPPPVPADPVFAARLKGWMVGGWPPAPAAELALRDPSEAIRVREMPEQTKDQKAVQVVDPTELLALALWHGEKAKGGDPAGELWLDPWRVESEPLSTSTAAATDDLLFAGFATTSEDLAFLAQTCRGTGPIPEAPQSPAAAVLSGAVEAGKLDVQRLLERSQAFSTEILAAMAQKAGQEEGFHRTFADLGRLGALRAGICVAERLGQAEDAGLIRVNIHDLSEGPTRDPVFTLSLAAWDAAHRNAVRSLDLVHSLTTDFPQLELARVPLDAMSVRLSRNSAPSAPVH